jgi:hypothetical protein
MGSSLQCQLGQLSPASSPTISRPMRARMPLLSMTTRVSIGISQLGATPGWW